MDTFFGHNNTVGELYTFPRGQLHHKYLLKMSVQFVAFGGRSGGLLHDRRRQDVCDRTYTEDRSLASCNRGISTSWYVIFTACRGTSHPNACTELLRCYHHKSYTIVSSPKSTETGRSHLPSNGGQCPGCYEYITIFQ